MKVLIVCGHYYPNVFGGAEKVAQGLAEALAKRDHEVVVATVNPHKRREVNTVNGVKVHYLPNQNIYFFGLPKRRSTAAKLMWHGLDTYNPRMASLLGSVLEADCPDVVNTHFVAGFSVAAWSAVKNRALPLVHTTHGPDLLCPKGKQRKGAVCSEMCGGCRLYAWPRVLLSRKVDVLTGVSHHTLEDYDGQGAFPNAEKVVIYNACGISPPPTTSRKCCDEPFRFGFLGRLHPTKGLDMLLRSFRELPEKTTELLIAGRGAPSYEKELRRVADGHPGIRWLGFVSPESLLRQVDVMVVPSLWHDPAPLSVLESVAYGVPVIGSRRGGIPELMGEGTGWIYDPDTPGALTATMWRALESRNELAMMRERAIQRARQFSTEAMVNGYLQAYALAIEKNKRK